MQRPWPGEFYAEQRANEAWLGLALGHLNLVDLSFLMERNG